METKGKGVVTHYQTCELRNTSGESRGQSLSLGERMGKGCRAGSQKPEHWGRFLKWGGVGNGGSKH